MRKIDCVTVKGSARPMVLYTLDVSEDEENVRAAERLDPTAIQEEEGEEGAGEEEGESTDDEDEEVDEELVEAEKEALEELEHERKMFERVDKIYKLKRTTTPEFMALWDSARDKYLAGEWGEAHALFVQCEQMLPDDGPTQTLKSYIERRDCVAPSSWKGAAGRGLRACGRPRALGAALLTTVPPSWRGRAAFFPHARRCARAHVQVMRGPVGPSQQGDLELYAESQLELMIDRWASGRTE